MILKKKHIALILWWWNHVSKTNVLDRIVRVHSGMIEMANCTEVKLISTFIFMGRTHPNRGGNSHFTDTFCKIMQLFTLSFFWHFNEYKCWTIISPVGFITEAQIRKLYKKRGIIVKQEVHPLLSACAREWATVELDKFSNN